MIRNCPTAGISCHEDCGPLLYQNGYEFIQHHKPHLWDEIVSAIESVDASVARTKVSREKTMAGARLYAPRVLNKAMETAFRERGWRGSRTDFWVTGDPKTINRTLRLDPSEQRAVIERAGLEANPSFNQTTS